MRLKSRVFSASHQSRRPTLPRPTPSGKIVTHVLLHEIRHWAQIATLLRLHGLKDELHDFIFTPVLGGEIRRNGPKS
ncbi:MAG TPA: DinB family protein [Candidatus Acidoferrales bacterium]|nr:DinB family protein [Candidatus Acidoferrales bacterium]